MASEATLSSCSREIGVPDRERRAAVIEHHAPALTGGCLLQRKQRPLLLVVLHCLLQAGEVILLGQVLPEGVRSGVLLDEPRVFPSVRLSSLRDRCCFLRRVARYWGRPPVPSVLGSIRGAARCQT